MELDLYSAWCEFFKAAPRHPLLKRLSHLIGDARFRPGGWKEGGVPHLVHPDTLVRIKDLRWGFVGSVGIVLVAGPRG